MYGPARRVRHNKLPISIIEAWNNVGRDFTVSNIYYDKNGNLKAMDQRGVKPGSGVVDMDFLRYTYENGQLSNRLAYVTDNATDHGLGDFVNTNGGGIDYSYTENGFLKSDANKGIASISYTYFNKPQVVTFSNGNAIEYSYDATGAKLQELVKENGKPDKVTDYVNGYVYENNVLQYMLTPEGRAVRYAAADTFKDEYFVKDHLGNVRSTIDVSDKPLQQYLATYEIASANLEGLLFDRVNEIREDKPNSTDPGDVKSGLLNGNDPNRRTGTSLLMHVMADDQVEISVNNFYENYDKDQDNPVSASDMLESILGTLTGGSGGLGGSESHNPDMVSQLFGPDNYLNAYEGLVNSATDAAKPKAYLNYILFDENMQVRTEFSKAIQVNGNGSWQTIGTNGALTVPVNGYLAVYLSSSSNTVACVPCSDIYFDQLVIKIQKGRLLEETHYYPHGLPILALNSDAVNHTKANRHKYQSNEYIKDLGLNWMDFHARQYDPQLGRFLGVDPLADAGGQQTLSPYAAMGNAPESMVDPNGEMAMYNLLPMDAGNSIDFMGEISPTINDMMSGNMGGEGSLGGWGDHSLGTGGRADGKGGWDYGATYKTEKKMSNEERKAWWATTLGSLGVGKRDKAAGNLNGDTNDKKNGGSSGNNGLTMYWYKEHKDGQGVDLGLGFDGKNGNYTDFRWLQVISTNSPYGTFDNVYLDPQTGGSKDNLPFYYTESEHESYATVEGKTRGQYMIFWDAPRRGGEKSVYWHAELSVVGKRDGVYYPIATITYGFELNRDGILKVLPIKYNVTPSVYTLGALMPSLLKNFSLKP